MMEHAERGIQEGFVDERPNYRHGSIAIANNQEAIVTSELTCCQGTGGKKRDSKGRKGEKNDPKMPNEWHHKKCGHHTQPHTTFSFTYRSTHHVSMIITKPYFLKSFPSTTLCPESVLHLFVMYTQRGSSQRHTGILSA